MKATLREWKVRAPKFAVDLPRRLKRPDGVAINLMFPYFKRGKRMGELIERHTFDDFEYRLIANNAYVRIFVDKMLDNRSVKRLPQRAEVTVALSYVPE